MVKRTKVVIGVALLLALAVIIAADHVVYTIGDGWYDLTVTIRSKSGKSIQKVECRAWFLTDELRQLAAGADFPNNLRITHPIDPGHVEDFQGKPLIIDVFFSVRTSISGRTLRYSQNKHLLVLATYEDGARVFRIFDIPDRKVSETLTVEMP